MRRWLPLAVLVALCLAPNPVTAGYVATNLASDLDMGPGVFQDPDMVNPWGLTVRGASPFWVANNGTGVATLYNTSSGVAMKQGLVVTVGSGAPITGTVGNLSSSFNGDLFLFAAENGGIYGWRGALGTTAETLLSPTSSSVYKGLAINGSTLYAANFRSGEIDVFAGGFGSPLHPMDPDLPKGFGPFGMQLLNGKIYVTFARQDAAKHDDDPGPGRGFVDVLDPATNQLTRLISRVPLDSPRGLAIAPRFGGERRPFGWNFGDGRSTPSTTAGAFRNPGRPGGNPIHRRLVGPHVPGRRRRQTGSSSPPGYKVRITGCSVIDPPRAGSLAHSPWVWSDWRPVGVAVRAPRARAAGRRRICSRGACSGAGAAARRPHPDLSCGPPRRPGKFPSTIPRDCRPRRRHVGGDAVEEPRSWLITTAQPAKDSRASSTRAAATSRCWSARRARCPTGAAWPCGFLVALAP
jgi:uncharacterized protein (TIGR03118 family)